MEILGIDSGSGIKGGIVETTSGQQISERHYLPTQTTSALNLITSTVYWMIKYFNWNRQAGCSFPTVVIDGTNYTNGNIGTEWLDIPIDILFSQNCTGLTFFETNDADLAGITEINLGAGRDKGKVMPLTIRTGLGTSVFYNGQFIPNIKLARIFHMVGKFIELFDACATKNRENLSLREWAERFNYFLNHIKRIFSPGCFFIGGELSEKIDEFRHNLTVDVEIKTAHFKNDAGIIGSAIFVQQQLSK